ncbi:MAG: hypothetical protein ACE5I4_07175, partial [Thermoplasmata archaeon]
MTVINSTTELDESEDLIYTYSRVKVSERLEGAFIPKEIVIRTLGGTVDNITLFAMPHFRLVPGQVYNTRLSQLRDDIYTFDRGPGAYAPASSGAPGAASSSSKTGGLGYQLTWGHWAGYGTGYYINSAGTLDMTGENGIVIDAFDRWTDDPV